MCGDLAGCVCTVLSYGIDVWFKSLISSSSIVLDLTGLL